MCVLRRLPFVRKDKLLPWRKKEARLFFNDISLVIGWKIVYTIYLRSRSRGLSRFLRKVV